VKPFVGNDYPTVGVEQEFHLIDGTTGELSPSVEKVFGELDEQALSRVSLELYLSVLEQQSTVCRTVDELLDDVISGRRALADACGRAGVRLAAAGSHPFSDWRAQPIVPSEHYQWVVQECVYVAHRMVAFGLHVHVGMQNEHSAMYALHEMRRWTYPLLALSANSPFFEGHPTGLASTRTALFNSMPRTLMPPEFADMAELEAFYEKLVQCGDVTSPGDLWWVIRPQPPLGTVELRVFDLPTEAKRIGALVAVTQAAMAFYQDRFNEGTQRSDFKAAYLEQNRWKAIRYGLDGKIIDPESGELLSTRAQLERLFDMIAPKADELGSTAHLEFAADMLQAGTEAQWQIKTCEQFGGDLAALELEIARRTLDY